jgi:3-dehydroquinate synthase
MQTLFSCTLGDKTTLVYSTQKIPSIFENIATFAGKHLYVCDSQTSGMLPASALRIQLPCGEQAKQWESVERIITMAKAHNFGRDDRFIGLGGGVICDITAFVASIYMRGCSLTLIPTTLLAMVDASLGGKTAIDLGKTKNLVGTFYPAQEIIICPATLATLSDDEYHNGLGEVLKHALLAQNDDLMQFLKTFHKEILERNSTVLHSLLAASLRVKQYYVEQDALEQHGVRDALNLGHTFAHALETVGSLTQYAHGEAVAWGITKALQVGLHLGVTNPVFAERATTLLQQYEFRGDYKVVDTEQFMEALQSDKKKRNAILRFVLMEGQGRYKLMPLDDEMILNVIS